MEFITRDDINSKGDAGTMMRHAGPRLVEDRTEQPHGSSTAKADYGVGICGYRKCDVGEYPKQRSWQKFCCDNHRSLEWQEVTRIARKVYLKTGKKARSVARKSR